MSEDEPTRDEVEEVLIFKPHIIDRRELPEKWVCETNNGKHWFADAPAHCPFCGEDLRYDKYHKTHYREKRFYDSTE